MSGQDLAGKPEARAAHYRQVARLHHILAHGPHWRRLLDIPPGAPLATFRAAAERYVGLTPPGAQRG